MDTPVIETSPAAVPYVGTADFETRNATLKSLSLAAGIRLPETRVAEGESLLPIGEENKRALACEIAQLPDLGQGLGIIRDRIAQEAPRDVAILPSGIRLDPSNGALRSGQDGPSVGYTEAGFSHIVGTVKPASVRAGAATTLLSLRPAARAAAFNDWAERRVADPDGDKIVLRTIVDPRSSRRVVRAATSLRHSLETGDDLVIADALQASVPAGAKVRITRTWDRTDFEVIWPALDRELKVGDVALIALSVSNSETRAGSLKVEPKLLRVLCYNFTTAYSDGADETISLKHIGDLRSKLPAAFARALRVIDPFVRAFGDAYKVALPEFAPTRADVLGRVGKRFELVSDSTLTLAAKLWDADGAKSAGDTLAGLVNALTRASQEEGLEAASVTERAAGRLIHEGWGALA